MFWICVPSENLIRMVVCCQVWDSVPTVGHLVALTFSFSALSASLYLDVRSGASFNSWLRPAMDA